MHITVSATATGVVTGRLTISTTLAPGITDAISSFSDGGAARAEYSLYVYEMNAVFADTPRLSSR